ncbi:DUF624 domain-containing protein [Ruania alba]|uniref:Membrane protein YesL n=1 Tax=Ruania alba TaxID=648782 RepID=A0A1H5B6R2_9MICO|nr:DUF624 domain-containing protein [Ruania alba]SED50097.1 Protein of unknown function, DUF624 [Ruania alba]
MTTTHAPHGWVPHGSIRRLSVLALGATWLVYLALLWVLACIPVVTAPAATVALVERVRAWDTDGDVPSCRRFLASMGRHGVARSATVVGVLVVYAVLAADLHALGLMEQGRRAAVLIWFAVSITAALLTAFVLPTLANSVVGLAALKRSALLAIARAPLAAAVVAATGVAALIVVSVPLSAPAVAVALAWLVGRIHSRAVDSVRVQSIADRRTEGEGHT